jgi:hypothetical protein
VAPDIRHYIDDLKTPDVYERPTLPADGKSDSYLGEIWRLVGRSPFDNDLVSVAADLHVTGTLEKDHRAWMFVDGGFVGNCLDVDIENQAAGQIDGLRMHEVAFEEKLDPTAILGDPEYDTRGVSHALEELFTAT